MRKVNSAIDGLRPSGSLLQQMFSNVAEAAGNFGREILNVAEVALGVMLRDAIEFVLGQLRALIDDVIEAGSQFQILELRLQRLNFNTLVEGGMDFNKATEESIRLTQEQLQWLQKLAATSPYDASDIANTFTLARAYGFTNDEAKTLTDSIINFAAGMGLTNEEMSRIIINFGQLQQQGKLNAQDLKDLARGAFVPINDVLEKMAKNMGISIDELNGMRKAGKGGPEMVTQFIKAFNELVGERFAGASEKMSRTFVGAKQNVADLFKSILGLGVVTPVLDVIGSKLADFVEAFTGKPERWDALVKAAGEIGKAFSDVMTALFDLLPSADSVASSVIDAFTGVAKWVTDHKEDIVGFFKGVWDFVNTNIIPLIRDQLIPTFQRIAGWVMENGPLIMQFFGSLGDILTTVFGNLFGGAFAKGDFLGGVLDAIKGFMTFVVQNKDQIAEFVTNLIRVAVVVEIVITAFNIMIGIVGSFIGLIIGIIAGFVSLVATVFGVISAITFLAANFIPLLVILGAIIAIVQAVIDAIQLFLTVTTISDFIRNEFIPSIISGFEGLRDRVFDAVNGIMDRVHEINWGQLGTDIANGIADGLSNGAGSIIFAAENAARDAYFAARRFLGIRSPSKLFMDIGQLSMEGMAAGIEKYAGLAASAMGNAMQQVSMPAMILPAMAPALAGGGGAVSYSTANNNSYNLNIQSSADREPLIQDFGMLKSLQGG